MNDAAFWKKVKRNLGKVPFTADVVALYFCMRDPFTPIWAKAQIAAAIAYFISPIDAIPDAIPLAGYADDAGVIAGTLTLVAAHVTAEHKSQALHWLNSEPAK